MKDELDKVFETPEESLAYYLKSMPNSLMLVFQREFIRRKKVTALEQAAEKMKILLQKASVVFIDDDLDWGVQTKTALAEYEAIKKGQ